MKKLATFACIMMMGAAAFASSLGVPWFVDSATPGLGIPPVAREGLVGAVLGVVYLHNNAAEETVCAISYFNANGDNIGTRAGDGTTFAIAANASVAFRPNAQDPSTTGLADLLAAGGTAPANILPNGARGQEELAGYLIPNRNNVDGLWNGSCVIQWVGPSTLIQGAYMQFQPTTSVAYLLPPGA